MTRIALCLVLSGCASLFADDTATIAVSAYPGQPVTVDGAPAGTSPTQFVVSTHTSHVIEVGGHRCEINAGIGPLWIVLDIVAGVWPLIVDALTDDWRTADTSTCLL